VLTVEVEHVNRQANILKKRIVLDHLRKGAIVVKEDVVGLYRIGTCIDVLYKILEENSEL
jgi:hypothetical protein